MENAPRDIPKFANVYAGTSTGIIRDASQCLIGCRVVRNEQFGTIKYVGPISGSTVIWLGIDWDNPSNGRHNGTLKGTTYFNARHHTSGSFLKPEKASLGTSLEEALVTRYAMCAECQIIARNPDSFRFGGDPVSCVTLETGAFAGQLKATLDMSANEAEFLENEHIESSTPFTVEIFTNSSSELNNHQTCGAAGATQQLSRLRNASILGMPVYRGLRKDENLADDVRTLWPDLGGRFSNNLGSLCDLDLSGCLISKWTEVANICSHLPSLLKLNVGYNCLRLPRSTENELHEFSEVERRLRLDIDAEVAMAEALCSSAFPSLTRFVAVQMLAMDDGMGFKWNELTRILGWMPSLRKVCIAYNELGDPPKPSTEIGNHLTNLLQRLTEVDISGTGQTNFDCILALLVNSPCLTNLNLGVNRIREIHLPHDTVPFPSVTELTFRDNLIDNWESVNALARLPCLSSLIISQNPILNMPKPETARQEVIACLPRLQRLNRQEISRDERRGAELDYLKRHGNAWIESEKQGKEAKLAFLERYPVFEHLCKKYGPPESGETKSTMHALKEGLVELTISCDPPTSSAASHKVVRRLPARMTVNHLRSLVRRLFHLPTTATINLVTWGARPGFDEIEVPLDSDTRELGFFGVVSGDRLVVQWLHES